jgi:hypothetical protein
MRIGQVVYVFMIELPMENFKGMNVGMGLGVRFESISFVLETSS